jgi:hypothetical protein
MAQTSARLLGSLSSTATRTVLRVGACGRCLDGTFVIKIGLISNMRDGIEKLYLFLHRRCDLVLITWSNHSIFHLGIISRNKGSVAHRSSHGGYGVMLQGVGKKGILASDRFFLKINTRRVFLAPEEMRALSTSSARPYRISNARDLDNTKMEVGIASRMLIILWFN